MSQVDTILLVEDDSDLRELLQEELEAEGYQVTACGDAEQGKAFLASQAPDLLISDLRLPGADGLSLLPNLSLASSPPAVLIITASTTGGTHRCSLSHSTTKLALMPPLRSDALMTNSTAARGGSTRSS